MLLSSTVISQQNGKRLTPELTELEILKRAFKVHE
jgi:hypothetical protein